MTALRTHVSSCRIEFLTWIVALGIIVSGTGCTPAQVALGTAGGIAGATVVGGQAPGHQLEQVYYFGVLDPQEQVPPAVYRVRVSGQASAISRMQFGSGWVPAQLIDSLNTVITFKDGAIDISGRDADRLSQLQTGRRLVMFGPEGFREAPKDHRLVIVMGASPEEFFKAIDQSTATLSGALVRRRNAEVQQLLTAALLEAKYAREELLNLKLDLAAEAR